MKDFDTCIDLQDFLAEVGEYAKTKSAYGAAIVLYCKNEIGTVQYHATMDDLAMGATALHLFSQTTAKATIQ